VSPARQNYYRGLFLISAIYDLAVGIVFAFFYRSAFGWLGVIDQLPRFEGYLTLLGAFVFVIGVAYFLIFRGDLRQNRDLILVGTLYKLAYSAVAFYYFSMGGLPHVIFAALFGVADALFFILMAECWMFLARTKAG
jgi:hypothetical protein